MRIRGAEKSITILGVVGKPLSNLAAAVASKGLKPAEVQTKITDRSKSIAPGTPIVIKITIGTGNVYKINVREGPTRALVAFLQPDYVNGVKLSTVKQMAEMYIKSGVENTSNVDMVIKTISNVLGKSFHLQVEGYNDGASLGGSNV